ncbi:hypothetical protein [Salinispira pacifica]
MRRADRAIRKEFAAQVAAVPTPAPPNFDALPDGWIVGTRSDATRRQLSRAASAGRAHRLLAAAGVWCFALSMVVLSLVLPDASVVRSGGPADTITEFCRSNELPSRMAQGLVTLGHAMATREKTEER